MKSVLTCALCLLLASCLVGGTPAAADEGAKAAARSAQAEYGGRVLKVERGEAGYRVKLLQPSGRVKVVVVPDAARKPPPRKAEAPDRSP